MSEFKLDKGLTQIYTGSGKGKTTASFGLIWRMLGYGGKVYLCQFLKPDNIFTGESAMADKADKIIGDNLKYIRAEYKWDMSKSHDPDQRAAAAVKIKEVLAQAKDALASGNYSLVVLDELVVCYSMKLVTLEEIEELIANKADHTELVITGRGGDEPLYQLADLVTEMKEIKHPFNCGIDARKGIEY